MACVVIAMTEMAWCAGPLHFVTDLDVTGGLGPGDPVTQAGIKIGHVTSVKPMESRRTEVGIEIDPNHADIIRANSILLLNNLSGTPSLEVIFTDPSQPEAANGSFISGASNPAQAQMLLAARNENTLTAAYRRLLSNFGGLWSPTNTSPAAAQMQQDLMALWQAVMMTTTTASPEVRTEIGRVERDEEAVEHELLREGNAQAAEKLRDDTYRMLAFLHGTPVAAAAPSRAPSNTLTLPHASPTGTR